MNLTNFRYFNKSKYLDAKTHINKCDITSINECPYDSIKDCNMDKSNCQQKKIDKKKENKYSKILWSYLLIALLVYFVITIISENKNINTVYGDFNSEITVETGKITFIRTFKLNSFRESPENYEDFRKFFNEIYKFDNEKIVMVKNE